MALYRTIGGGQHVQRLSMGDTIADADDERTFLATRHMDDSSIVYFLSIIGAKRQDAGDYSCRVISAVGVVAEVAADSVAIDVAYFPSDNFPICSTPGAGESQEMTEGSVVEFKCASEITRPAVIIHWTRNSAILETRSTVDMLAGEQYSVLSFRVDAKDNRAVFLCEISSPMFPGLTRTCHVGPIRVLKKSPDSVVNGDQFSNTPMPPVDVAGRLPGYPSNSPTGGNLTSNCREFCASELASDTFYWVVAAVASVLFAVIFLLLALTLSIKYCHLTNAAARNNSSANNNYSSRQLHRMPTEYIYTEVDTTTRRDLEKNYMSLERKDPRKYQLE